MTHRKYGAEPWQAIVLHGGPGAPGCAAGLCRGLEGQCGIIEHLQKARSTEGLIEEIRMLMDECELRKTMLIGHSFGAWLALLFAWKYPERMSRVILIGCGPLEQKYLPELIRTREERKQAGVDTDNFCPLSGSGGDMLYFDEEQHHALMKEVMSLRESGELLNRAKAVACPITAFHGIYDPHPVDGIREPMRGQENFSLIELERCGHDPWKEKWAREIFFERLCGEICK